MADQPTPDAPAAAAGPPPGPVEAEEARSYLEGIRDNYSRYVATGPIPVGNALAANTGDAINADHPQLKQWLTDGLVEDTAKGKKKA